jgi:hypothetical protein
MERGERVEVHVAYTDGWTSGFEIAEVLGDVYRLRRCSDGSVLPVPMSAADLRPMWSPHL